MPCCVYYDDDGWSCDGVGVCGVFGTDGTDGGLGGEYKSSPAEFGTNPNLCSQHGLALAKVPACASYKTRIALKEINTSAKKSYFSFQVHFVGALMLWC